MSKRMIQMLAVVLAIVGILGFIKFQQISAAISAGKSFTMPPEAVTTVVAQPASWEAGLTATGSVEPTQGVTLSADQPGIVEKILFESGSHVGEGQILVQLDTRQERAQLASAEAQRDLAKTNFDRSQALIAQKAIAQQDFDQVSAQFKQADAAVREMQSAIDRKTIRAPFAGTAGIRMVNLGQYLHSGDPVVPLQSIDRVFVDFAVPQQQVASLRVGATVHINADSMASSEATGRVTAINPVADDATRNVQVQATFSNPRGHLRPGMYVNVQVTTGAGKPVIALPTTAINYAPYGNSVFIVEDMKDPKGKTYKGVRQQFVQLGQSRGDQVAVLTGVTAGQEIVSSGVFKLRTGAGVTINNAVKPSNSTAPKPEDKLMRLTDLFIKRPVLAIVVNLIILIAGLQSIRSLSVRQFPRSDMAVVTVTTAYIGANADLVRGFITSPLERVIASADGIDYIESSSAQSVSTITVHLKLNYDTNAALTQVQAKVAQVRNDLPPEAQAPVIEVETADSQFASMYLGFTSKDLDQSQISDYLVRVVQPRLSAVSGVQRADLLGGRQFAMRVWLKPDRMASRGLSPSQVWTALSQNNYLSALGATKGTMTSVNLVANTDLKTPEEFRRLVVKQDGADVVRLGDVADVVLGAEDYNTEVRFNGQTATFMGIWVLPSANALDVIARVREAMKGVQSELPAGMTATIPYDATENIQDAIHEVLKTLIETLLIVILVIFLFIGSIRGLVIPLVAIPISLIGAVFIMQTAGFTINLLTLLAIVLSVGLVVDDAIVMVENIERHVHEGQPPMQAALNAARELIGPIISMTITLIAVYLPIGLQGGLTGSLFREFAFTLAGAVLISGIVALTLSPMMGSRLLRAGDSEKGFAGIVNRFFDRVRNRYSRMLAGTLQYRPVVLTLWVIVILLMFPFYMFAQKELAPPEDQSVVFGIVQAAPNATIDQTKMFTKSIFDVYHSMPEYKNVFQITFPSGGFGGMVTKPWSERKRSTAQINMEASAKMGQIPGVRIISLTPPSLPGGGSFPVDLVIASTAEPKQLLDIANTLVQKAYASGMFMYVDTDLKFDQPQAEVVFDRDKVRSLGVDMSQAGRDLSTMLGGNFVNRFSIQGRSYKVIPQIKRSERLTPEQLSSVYVTGPGGKLVPLSTFATLKTSTEPRELKRFQQLNAVRIQAVIPPNVPLEQALGFMETEARKILPAGYTIDYAGESRQLRTEGGKFLGVFLLSAILIFLVLAAQFESFRDPFVILAGSAPLALTGSLMFMFLGFTSLNIYSQVGLITLVGLIAKNGILIVEFANHLQTTGLDKSRAVVEAAATRLRPILMTTAATVFGHLPLVFARGPGAGARNSIGIALVTGMVIGTAFTLFVVPAIYTLVAKVHKPEEALEPATGRIETTHGHGPEVAPV